MSGLLQGSSSDKLDTVEGVLRCHVVRKMTFEVSGDAEVLGFLGLGSSLTLEWGLGMRGSELWLQASGMGGDLQGRPL